VIAASPSVRARSTTPSSPPPALRHSTPPTLPLSHPRRGISLQLPSRLARSTGNSGKSANSPPSHRLCPTHRTSGPVRSAPANLRRGLLVRLSVLPPTSAQRRPRANQNATPTAPPWRQRQTVQTLPQVPSVRSPTETSLERQRRGPREGPSAPNAAESARTAPLRRVLRTAHHAHRTTLPSPLPNATSSSTRRSPSGTPAAGLLPRPANTSRSSVDRLPHPLPQPPRTDRIHPLSSSLTFLHVVPPRRRSRNLTRIDPIPRLSHSFAIRFGSSPPAAGGHRSCSTRLDHHHDQTRRDLAGIHSHSHLPEPTPLRFASSIRPPIPPGLLPAGNTQITLPPRTHACNVLGPPIINYERSSSIKSQTTSPFCCLIDQRQPITNQAFGSHGSTLLLLWCHHLRHPDPLALPRISHGHSHDRILSGQARDGRGENVRQIVDFGRGRP
jgi:hypothetical protein